MSSKKYEIDGGSVWFPSRMNAREVISLRYFPRSCEVEIWAIIDEGYTSVYRIPFNDLLLALNVPREDQR